MNDRTIDEATFDLPELCCSEEMGLVEKAISRLSGIESARPDYVDRTLRVAFDPARVRPSGIIGAIEDAGFAVLPHGDVRVDRPRPSWRWRATTVAGGVLLAMAVAWRILLGEASNLVAIMLIVSTLVSGVPVLRAALRAIRLRALDMNVLMSIAAVGAVAIGERFEAATAMFLFAVSLWLESHGMDRARRAVRSLASLSATVAHRMEGQGIRDVEPAELAVGDLVLVRPGERLPIDGVVLQGCSAVNQAPITGESVPVEKSPGESVFAGSLNGEGSLQVEARKTAESSTLAHIARLVAEAESRRAPTERFIDRFARRYTPVVIGLALLLAFGPPLLGRLGVVWAAETDATEWFRRALVLLVIACPCALVISTPVTIVCGLFQAARRGILIKGGEHLENAGRIDAMAFDKTGTLTTGEPRVVEVVPWIDSHAETVSSAETLLQAAASLELHSEHPLARAIVAEARRRDLPLTPPEDFRALRGFGAEGVVGGQRLMVGNPRLFVDADIEVDPAVRTAAGNVARDISDTLVLVANEETLLGTIRLADPLRPRARETLAQLRRKGVRTLAMLTGDRCEVAEAIARELNLDEIHAELLPEDKVRHVENLAASHDRLAMVGDGVNDAPALAAAPLGIALGRDGSDTALETAGVVVMTPNLDRLVELMTLGQRCRRILWQNIVFALTTKLAVLLLAAAGLATMWMAVFADVGAGLLVTFNGLRLARATDRPSEDSAEDES
ncbi:MAG TPA: heavy metal translocating P-type ATPase [Planctomycetaceae bacterium]|nr:heavy metal translocating P-type ATPase [Planctomycetaceae bacterium]